MRTNVACVGLMVAAAIFAAAGPETPATSTQESAAVQSKRAETEVMATIDETIKSLEAKDYAKAFRKIAGPIAEKADKEGKFDHSVEVLKAGMGEELLKGLKAAKEGRVSVEEDMQTVTFDVSEKFPDSPKMVFKKWEKGWYLD